MWRSLILLLLTYPVFAQQVYVGKVVHIADGDTLSIMWRALPRKCWLLARAGSAPRGVDGTWIGVVLVGVGKAVEKQFQ